MYSKLNKNVKSKTKGQDEDLPMFGQEIHLGFIKKSIPISQVSFSLDEEFKDPKYYRNIIEEMSGLTQHDEVVVRINSPGGYVSGLIGLLDAVEDCEAMVTAHIVGECHSAASIFALRCPRVSVGRHATMMIHNLSYGVGGKESDVYAHVLHTNEFAKTFVKETYKDFLTAKEIEEVLNGKEIWMNSTQIEERLVNRDKIREKEFKKSKSKTKAAVESVIPENI